MTIFAGMAMGTIVILSILGFVIYFLPSLIAWKRKHHQLVPIVLLNIFLGWSVLGWVISLVWAFMSPSAAATTPSGGQSA